MYEVKKEMNDDIKYSDLFEDISIRIKKEGKYNINPSKIPKISPSQKIKDLLSPLSKAEGEGAEKTLVTNVNFVPDYLDLFQKFSFFCFFSFSFFFYLHHSKMKIHLFLHLYLFSSSFYIHCG